MATYSTPKPFQEIVRTTVLDIASYAHNNGECGYTAAVEFQEVLNTSLFKIASTPLTYSSPWGQAQRRAFLDYKGQYTLIFIYKPFNASSNSDIGRIIFSDLYPSRTIKGNTPRPNEITFDAGDILEDS